MIGLLTSITLITIGVNSCKALSGCNQTVSPTNYRALPTIYKSVSVINPGVGSCSLVRTSFFECNYNIVLGDGVSVPSSPDLNNQSYLEHFIAWKRNSLYPYVDFDISGSSSSITAIELSFLNSPANSISLPDIKLIEIRYGTSISGNQDVECPIPSLLVDNQDLTQSDNQLRTVTVLLHTLPSNTTNIRVRYVFTESHTFDWLLLSEVKFCTDGQPNFHLEIIFEAPKIDNMIIQPSARDLSSRSTELTCTVSNEGPHTWQWKKDNEIIRNGDQNIRFIIGDGSRTTKLMISDLDFSDAGRYECEATTTDLANITVSASRVQDIQFPENIITASDVVVSQDSGKIVLNCEAHGYQSSLTVPVWLNANHHEINSSAKYTIIQSKGTNAIVLTNGTTHPSIAVCLTIHNLTTDDEGRYTCRGENAQNVSNLAFIGSTSTISLSTTPANTQPMVPVSTIETESTLTSTPITIATQNTTSDSINEAMMNLNDHSMTLLITTVITTGTAVALLACLIITVFYLVKKNKNLSLALEYAQSNNVNMLYTNTNTNVDDTDISISENNSNTHDTDRDEDAPDTTVNSPDTTVNAPDTIVNTNVNAAGTNMHDSGHIIADMYTDDDYEPIPGVIKPEPDRIQMKRNESYTLVRRESSGLFFAENPVFHDLAYEVVELHIDL